jgi:hypothetical protein
MNGKLYVLGDDNHEGDEGIHGIFSTLAKAEEYQFQQLLGKVFTSLVVFEIDKPESKQYIPQLIRFNEKLEAAFAKENPNHKQEALARCTWFCDDCQKQLTACWECGFFHCKCKLKNGN